MIRRLVLWDVDGTLVRAGDLGAAVFDLALEAVVGRAPTNRVRMSGKTDPLIVREYLDQMDLEPTEKLVNDVLRGIEGHLAAAAAAGDLVAGGSACPGVTEALTVLAEDGRVISTLLTGNVAPNALVKVAAFGLEPLLDLDVGAYGSDHEDRNVLVQVAMKRVSEQRHVDLDAGDVWVIGDTPRDLECATAAGSRCLLVATGGFGFEELRELRPDAVLPDLSDTRQVVEILIGDL